MGVRGAFVSGLLTGVVLTGAAAVAIAYVRFGGFHGLAHPAASASAAAESASPSSTSTSDPFAVLDPGTGAGDAGVDADDDAAKGTPEAKLDVPDPSRVEPLELFGRAKALALKVEKRAHLVRIVVPPIADDGTVDLTKDRPLEYKFAYSYVEPSLPSDKNVFKGHVVVSASSKGLALTQQPARADDNVPDHALPDPRCTVKAAWKAVSTTSVPDAASARVVYERDARAKTGVWRFSFGNRSIGERIVDGASCALHSATPPSLASPPPRKSKK